MITRLFCSALLACLTSGAIAGPSPQIARLMDTPASAFDIYLHHLFVEGNGPTFFGGPNMREPMRMAHIKYDFDSNAIVMTFQVSSSHKSLEGFSGRTLDGKKTMLLATARKLAESVGTEYRDVDKTIRIGLIQATSIRYGWSAKEFNEDEIKEEIANRTELELIFSEDPRLVYRVRRSTRGVYEFSVDTKQR
jgi:hypothetical protein